MSVFRYREKLETVHQNCLNQVGELENLLDGLGKALSNCDLRIKCYKTEDGVEMHPEEKGPLGFVLNSKSVEVLDPKG